MKKWAEEKKNRPVISHIALDKEQGAEYYRVCRKGLELCGGARGVAQPGSASALGAESRRFKSSRPDQYNSSELIADSG